MTRLASLAVVLAIATSPGCASDPCSDGETVCVDDHTIRRCREHEDGWAVSYDWGPPEACYAQVPYCVTRDDIGPHVAPGRGMCATIPTKLASCSGVMSTCADGIAHECVDGYAITDDTCQFGCTASGSDCNNGP